MNYKVLNDNQQNKDQKTQCHSEFKTNENLNGELDKHSSCPHTLLLLDK